MKRTTEPKIKVWVPESEPTGIVGIKIGDRISVPMNDGYILSDIKAGTKQLEVPIFSTDKIYIGCDPGQSGGFVVLSIDGHVIEVFKTPTTRKEFKDKLSIYSYSHCFCLLEKVGCRPTNGAKANFTFGVNVERLLYTLELCLIPHQEVTPQSWMKGFMLKKEKTESHTQWKNRLKAKAEQLFPREKVTLWNADAFLIAETARRNFK